MSTTTIDEQLAELRRRVDRLQALGGAIAENGRIKRHLDALRRQDAAVQTALREASDEAEDELAQLRMRLAVAEWSLVADISDDWESFAIAVEEELRGWDTYLERLQTTAATRAWKARERAEVAIGEVRSCRIAVDARLAQVRNSAGDRATEQRRQVTEARDELGQKADELPAKLDRTEQT